MTRRLALATLLAATTLAGCEFGAKTTREAGVAACLPVQAACATNADCCSYGCIAGLCQPNPNPGGACRTTNDCGSLLVCKSSACTPYVAGLCRDDGDVCSTGSQCCTGNCTGAGRCGPNHAPTASAGPDVLDAPYTKVYTLTNLSSDPDGDPLLFGWTLVSAPAGSLAALSSATARTPTFTPDKIGPYVFRLVVTEGPAGTPNRLTAETTVTITAVNRVPVATATGPLQPVSRNVALTITGSAMDPDDDTLECSWQVTVPGASAPVDLSAFAPCANPTGTLSLPYTPTLEGAYQVALVVRDHDRTTNALVNTYTASASFTVVNDPPTPAVSRTPYYGNLGPAGGPNPPVQLDASPSTDTNGDHLLTPGLAFFWEMVSAADGGTLPAITAFDTATPSFVPDRATDFVLRLTVTDQAQFGRAGASSTLDVTVHVGRYVQPLAHDVLSSAYAKTADKLILAGHDPSDATKGMIWVYDAATGTEAAGIRLVDPVDATASGIPSGIGVTPDGTKVVVVDQGVSIWIVTLGATPSIARLARAFPVADLVVATNRYAYLFPGSDYVKELDLNSGGGITNRFSGYGGFGAAWPAASALYRVDTTFDYWDKYSVGNNGVGSGYTAYSGGRPVCGTGYYPPPAQQIWASASYIFTDCGTVYSATSLASLDPKSLGSASFVDAAATGAVLVLDAGGTSLRRFNSVLDPTGSDTLPRWAQNGFGRTAYGDRAFLNAAATKWFVVVSDTATPARHGIITFP